MPEYLIMHFNTAGLIIQTGFLDANCLKLNVTEGVVEKGSLTHK